MQYNQTRHHAITYDSSWLESLQHQRLHLQIEQLKLFFLDIDELLQCSFVLSWEIEMRYKKIYRK